MFIFSLTEVCGGGSPVEETCTCLNIRPEVIEHEHLLRTREVWIVVSLTIACLGIVICFSFLIWISCCKVTSCITSNILDGSQAFTMLLLGGLILIFATIIPYAFNSNPIVCALRSNCVPLAYVLVFSTMLSRSGNLSIH